MWCAVLNVDHFEGRWVWLSFNINFYEDGTPQAPRSVHQCLYHIWCTRGRGDYGFSQAALFIVKDKFFTVHIAGSSYLCLQSKISICQVILFCFLIMDNLIRPFFIMHTFFYFCSVQTVICIQVVLIHQNQAIHGGVSIFLHPPPPVSYVEIPFFAVLSPRSQLFMFMSMFRTHKKALIFMRFEQNEFKIFF